MEPLSVKRMVSARIPTDDAEFHLNLYHNNHYDKEHLAMVLGDVAGKPEVLVRLHSECFTGDVLGSRRCDCGEQLRCALGQIAAVARTALGKPKHFTAEATEIAERATDSS